MEGWLNMTDSVFYTPGGSAALGYAKEILSRQGIRFCQIPSEAVTHLLLGAPAFNDDGTLKGGQSLADILQYVGKEVTVIGGKLQAPILSGYKTIDLLTDPLYLAENADITAHCAAALAMQQLPVTLRNCPVLITGWGRIGKCLGRLLRNMGAKVTVAARKETDRAMLSALGYRALPLSCLETVLPEYRIIFNTIPHPVLTGEVLTLCRKDCVKIELASTPGILSGDAVIARGLPGKYAPESSGDLIAQTTLRYIGVVT